jgi:ATP-dependent Clp protease ATP-binding subunit ClpB
MTDKQNIRERLETVEEELAQLKEKSAQLKAHWILEKDLILSIQKIKENLEQRKLEMQKAEREANLSYASELRYSIIPGLETELEEKNEKLQELQQDRKMLKEEIGEEEVAEIVSAWTGIPVSKMLETEREKLLQMEANLKKRVVGQDEALQAVSDAVRRSRSGLGDPNRPIGSFMFLGPTGVGKTETARALAEFLFDDEDAMVRIDMTEYMEKHSISRLIGSPPGYVGYEEGGYLTESVRRRPYSVILFDEIEKAHPEVFNLLLQILDDGRLTDAHGKTVDFKNTVLIMTSNIGSQWISDLENEEEVRENVLQALRSRFRPEFLNRVDEIIIYHQLTKDDLKHIVEIQVRFLEKRLADRDIELELTDAVKAYLAEKGFDPNYGARPLKRLIQKEIENPLAMKLLDGEFSQGDSITVDYQDDEIVFR